MDPHRDGGDTAEPAGPDTRWALARRVRDRRDRQVGAFALGKPAGLTGTAISGGLIRGTEDNAALSHDRAQGTPWQLGVWAKMEREDPQIAGMLRSVSSVLLAAPWRIEPPKDADDDDLRAADLLAEELDGLEGGWRGFLRQALSFVPRGFSLFEEVHRRRPDGLIGLREFAPRLQSTVERWLTDAEDRLSEVEFAAPSGPSGTLRTYRLPADRLTLFSLDREGNNFEGRSILRPIHSYWLIKRHVLRATAMDAERAGAGFLKFAQTEQSAVLTDDDVATLHETALNWRANEFAHAILPWGVSLDFAFPAVPYEERVSFVRYLDQQIGKAFLLTFMELGLDKAGTQALGSTLAEHFLLSLRAVAGEIEDVLNAAGGRTVGGPLRRLCEMNFGRRLRWPRFRFGDLNADAGRAALGLILQGLPLGAFGRWAEADIDRARSLADLDPLPSDAGAAAGPGAGGEGTEGEAIAEPGVIDDAEEARATALATRRPDMVMVSDANGETIPCHRALLPGERAVAYGEIRRTLDAGEADVEAAARPILDRASRRMAGEVNAALDAADEAVRARAVSRVSVSDAERDALAAAVAATLVIAARTAKASAAREAGRAAGMAKAAPEVPGSAPPRGVAIADVARTDPARLAEARAVQVAEQMADEVQAAVRSAGMRAARSGSSRALRDAMDVASQRSAGWYRRIAAGAVGAVVAAARLDGGLEALSDLGVSEVGAVLYSSVLDGSTCGPCEAEDGREFPLGSEEFVRTQPPYGECEGRDACRCIHVMLP